MPMNAPSPRQRRALRGDNLRMVGKLVVVRR
jgi:hypothetical protein